MHVFVAGTKGFKGPLRHVFWKWKQFCFAVIRFQGNSCTVCKNILTELLRFFKNKKKGLLNLSPMLLAIFFGTPAISDIKLGGTLM